MAQQGKPDRELVEASGWQALRGMARSKRRDAILGQRGDHGAAGFKGQLRGFAKVTRDMTERREKEQS